MKEVIESNRPEEYFFELQKKKSEGKRLGQRERVFIELYTNKTVPCFHFVKQISPAILRYGSRISELRAIGFIIPPPTLSWHNGVKHSEYTLDKTHFEVEKKKKGFLGLW